MKGVYITGHSMGGSVAMIFAAVLVQFSERLRHLGEGESITVAGEHGESCTFTRLAADMCRIDRRNLSTCRAIEQTLPLKQIVWDKEIISVYTFSSTKPGNCAFTTLYDSLVPRSFNHTMGYDLVAPLVYPWFWRPGYTIEFYLKPSGIDALAPDSSYCFLSSLKSSMLGPIVNLVVFGIQYHGPSDVLIAAMFTWLEQLGAGHSWELLKDLVTVNPLPGEPKWLRVPTEEKDQLDDPAYQRQLLSWREPRSVLYGLALTTDDIGVEVIPPGSRTASLGWSVATLIGAPIAVVLVLVILLLVLVLALPMISVYVLLTLAFEYSGYLARTCCPASRAHVSCAPPPGGDAAGAPSDAHDKMMF